jgi:hypothetical protein
MTQGLIWRIGNGSVPELLQRETRSRSFTLQSALCFARRYPVPVTKTEDVGHHPVAFRKHYTGT